MWEMSYITMINVKKEDAKLCIREYQELNFVKNKQCIEKTKKKCTEMLSSVHNFKNN